MLESDLKGELSCPVCMELFSRPLRLGCGHSYCRGCLLAMAKRSRPGSISCPECRRVFEIPSTGVDAFPVDFKLSKLVDVYKRMEQTYDSFDPVTSQSSNADNAVSSQASTLYDSAPRDEGAPVADSYPQSGPRHPPSASRPSPEEAGHDPADITTTDDVSDDFNQMSLGSSQTNRSDTATPSENSGIERPRPGAEQSDTIVTLSGEVEVTRRRYSSVEGDGFVIVPNEPVNTRQGTNSPGILTRGESALTRRIPGESNDIRNSVIQSGRDESETRQGQSDPEISTRRQHDEAGSGMTREASNNPQSLRTSQKHDHALSRRPARAVSRHSDDSDSDELDRSGGVPRRRRKNKVLRFFSSLLSLSSSDDDAWKSSSSSLDSAVYRLPEKSLPPVSTQTEPAAPGVDRDVNVDAEAYAEDGANVSTGITTGSDLVHPDGSGQSINEMRSRTNNLQDRQTSNMRLVASESIVTASGGDTISAHVADSGIACVSAAGLDMGDGSVGTNTSTTVGAVADEVQERDCGDPVNWNDHQARGVLTDPRVDAGSVRCAGDSKAGGIKAATLSAGADTVSGERRPGDRQIAHSGDRQIAHSGADLQAKALASDVERIQIGPSTQTVGEINATRGRSQDVTSQSRSSASQQKSAKRGLRKKKKKRSLFSFFVSSSSSLSGDDVRDSFGSDDDDLLTDHAGSVVRMRPRDDGDDGLIQ